MRNNLEDNKSFNQHFQSGRFSHSRKVLIDDVVLTTNGSLVNFFDAGGADRTVTLPEFEEGRFYVVANIGAADDLVVRDSSGVLITTLLPADTALMFASEDEWVALRGWAALGVFTNTINGLVPAPNSLAPGSLFLRDDGQWAQVQVTGIVDAFKFITDGTNTAVGSGPDTFWLRSSTDKIGIVVTNGEAVFGDNANFTVNEAFVNHDLLLNFFADEHVGHSTVILTAGTGLSGGGDITASRSFDLDLNDLTTDTPVLTDTFAFYDVSGSDTNKATLATLNGILNHNSLLNYVADQHVAHSGVSIIAGTGLSGGGDITTSRTLNLNITGLTSDTPVVTDEVAFYDVSGSDHNKTTWAIVNGILDHNSLLNYVANRHIDHTAVVFTAGAGLTGGGDISASRTFDVGAGTGITVNANDVALDTTHIRNVDHSAVSIATAAAGGLSGGGTIDATRNLALAVDGLTADATPDAANDFVLTYDASASAHKKVLITNLPGGLNITGLTSTTPAGDDEIPVYDVSAAANRKVTVDDLGANFFASMPQGRLTLSSGIPVLNATTTGNAAVLFTPYGGNKWIVHDGSKLVVRSFSELSQALSDATKSPAAAVAASNYDIFGWLDSGTNRISRGPPWTSNTGRGTGAGTSELVRVNGVAMNAQNITNGPAAQRGVFLGTVRTRAADATIDWHLGGSASGGTPGVLGVWNNFNRVNVVAEVFDNGSGYTYSSATIRQARASAGNQVSFVCGLVEEGFSASALTSVNTVASGGAFGKTGFGVNSTTVMTNDTVFGVGSTLITRGPNSLVTMPGLGLNVISRNEGGDGSNANTFDGNGLDNLRVMVRM